MKFLEHWREMESAATPGPLFSREDTDYYQGGIYFGSGPAIHGKDPDNPGYLKLVPCDPKEARYFFHDVFRLEGSEKDGELLAMLRNCSGELRAVVEAAGWVLEEGHLREWDVNGALSDLSEAFADLESKVREL